MTTFQVIKHKEKYEQQCLKKFIDLEELRMLVNEESCVPTVHASNRLTKRVSIVVIYGGKTINSIF